MTAVAQTPDHPSILNKRSLSETDGMDVDENISHKKIKTHPQGDQTISEEIVSEDLKNMVLFEKKSVHMHQYSFEEEGNAESNSRYKSKTELVSSYADKQMQSSKETNNLLPRVRNLINQNTSLISTRDAKRNTLKFVVVSDKKVSEMEVKLEKLVFLIKYSSINKLKMLFILISYMQL